MSDIVAALWITLIGMGLVFVAILFLWGMMALMGRIPDGAEEEEPAPEAEEEAAAPALAEAPAEAEEADRRRKAAAAGVAVALAKAQAVPPLAVAVAAAAVAAARERAAASAAEGLDGRVSPWQTAMRSSRFSQRNHVYNRKTRG